MTVFKLYFDKDKETKWLNEMADKGLALVNFVAGFYTFESCEPGTYTYQIDWTKDIFSVSADYREFMKEMNTEIVCLWGPWVILRKKKSEGEFELYTDAQSKIEHYTKILWMFKIVACIEIICFGIEFYSAMTGSAVGLFGMVFVAIFCVVFIHMSLHTKKRINQLKLEAGLIDESKVNQTAINPLLTTGLFMNMIGQFINNNPDINDFIKGIVIGVAIVCMLAGIILTVKNVKNNNAEKEL